MSIFRFVIEALFHLNQGTSAKLPGKKAPHKPILLLALIQEIDSGRVAENRFTITPDLLATFRGLWSQLVEDNWSCKIFLPFYHMTNDTPSFWFIKTEPGATVMLTSRFSPRSARSLIDAIEFAYFSETVWRELQDSEKRKTLRLHLLHHYFPHKTLNTSGILKSFQHYRDQLEIDFYENRVADWLSDTYERQALRGTQFKTFIPKIYNYTCAISRQRIIAADTQMIDACHIKPWSRTKDDSIQNGIALTPTLHRAFDRGIVTINPDYTVSVSRDISESEDSPFNLGQFEGRKILLPKREEWWPSF